ncbi:MAG: SRPBCC family protein, partial [Proteobacteria bacterium]|nr:SRPBCC family protein [Pseudomonadota bacterium]
VVPGLPIATHGSTMTVTESDSGSRIQWKGAFYRSFPGQQPPPDQTDAACIEAVTKLYKTGLEGIKAAAEK